MQENYDFMNKAVIGFVKKHGVKIVLTQEAFTGLLRVYYYNWLGVDGKYYSLLAPCSYAKVYTTEVFSNAQGSLHQVLQKNLRVFESKDEWDAGKWQRDAAKGFNKMLQGELEKRAILRVSVGKYSVEDVQLHLQPALGMTVWYSKNGSDLESLTMWYGSKTTVFSLDRELAEFIDALGFAECVSVKLQSEQLRIGAFE